MKNNISNVAWALIERVVQISSAMLFTGIIARYFGIETFGAYQFATSVLLVATSLTWLCPTEMFYGRLDADGGLDTATIVTSVFYRFAISVIVFVGAAMYVAYWVDSGVQRTFILILSVAILYSEPLGIYRFLIETRGGYRLTARLRMLCVVLKVLAVYGLVASRANIIVVLIPVIAEAACVCIGCLWIYRKQGFSISIPIMDFDRKLAFQFLREGFRYWIGLAGMCFFLRVDRFFLEGRLSPQDFGAYSAAMSLLEQFTSVATMLVAVLGPMIVYRSTREKAPARVLALAALMGLAAVCGAAFLSFFSAPLISLLFGKDFSRSEEIFRFAILFAPLIYIDTALTTLLLREKATSLFAIKGVVACGVAIFVNYSFFSVWGWKSGIWGYGLGWSVSLAFTATYFFAFYRKVSLVSASAARAGAS